MQGTWDIPQKIPGNVTTDMARTRKAAQEIEQSQKDHEAFMKQTTTESAVIVKGVEKV